MYRVCAESRTTGDTARSYWMDYETAKWLADQGSVTHPTINHWIEKDTYYNLAEAAQEMGVK